MNLKEIEKWIKEHEKTHDQMDLWALGVTKGIRELGGCYDEENEELENLIAEKKRLDS